MPRKVESSASSLPFPKPLRSRAAKAASNVPSSRASRRKVKGEKFRVCGAARGWRASPAEKRAGRRKGKGAIEQDRIDAQPGLNAHVLNPGLADAVPIFERGLEVPLEEIEGREEVGGIGARWIQAQGAPEPFRRFGIALLFEGDAAEFEGEALIVGLAMTARKEGGAGLFPASELREGHAAVVVDVRCFLGAQQGNAGEQEWRGLRRGVGTARRVQLPVACPLSFEVRTALLEQLPHGRIVLQHDVVLQVQARHHHIVKIAAARVRARRSAGAPFPDDAAGWSTRHGL